MIRSAGCVIAALTVMGLGGCASGSRPAKSSAPPASQRSAPAWIDVMPSSPGVLYAVGSAPAGERERAVASARTELASEIEVSVEAEHTQRESTSTTADPSGKRTEHYDRDVRSQAHSRVAQRLLPGVVVRETYESSDRTWVLIAMDRSAWAAQLRSQIDALDARLVLASDEHLRVMWRDSVVGGHPVTDQAHAIPEAARYYQQIAPLTSERVELETRHRLAGGATLPLAPVDVDRVRADLSDGLRLLGIRVAATDGAAAMAPLARDACAKQGLRVDDALPQLVLRVSLTPLVERIGSEYRAEGTLLVALETAEAGRTLAEFTIDERASGLDADTARRRLLEKLAEAVAKRLDEQLVAYVARW